MTGAVSALLVTIEGRPRRASRPPREPALASDEGVWHDHHVRVHARPTAGVDRAAVLVASVRWLVAVAGWVSTAERVDVPIGAGGVCRLLDRRGPEALADLAGEHLLVAIDRTTSRWWAVRDGGGIHAAFWARGPNRLAIGDHAGDVASAAGIARDPDLGHLAALLAWGPSPGTDTPLVGLHRILGGHVLHGTAPTTTDPSAARWWSPPRASDLHPLDVDALRGELRSAIGGAAAAVGTRPLACELSGGLDSSLLTALAADASTTGTPSPVALTIVHGLDGDTDGPFAAAVASALGIDHLVIPWQARTADEIEAECEGGARLPDPANAMGQLYAVAADHGAGALVTGVGGDQWMNGSPVAALDNLLTARARRMLARRADHQHPDQQDLGQRVPTLADLGVGGPRGAARLGASLARATASGIVSASSLASPLVERRWRHRLGDSAPFVPAAALETHVVDRLRPGPQPGWRACDRRRALWSDGWERWSLGAYARPAALAGVLAVVPFWQRHVIAAALAVPEAARWSNGDRRALSRALLPSGIPDIVRHRPDKGDFTALFAAEAMWAPLGPVRTWRLVDHGLVDPDHPGVADLDARAVDDPWPVWQLAAAEWCLRAALADR